MRIALISDKIIDIDNIDVDYFSSKDTVNPKIWLKYDAAFLLEPFEKAALQMWTGHPHLRVCRNTDDLFSELKCLEREVETEKKYLISYPDFEALKKYSLYKSHIEQVYLKSGGGTHRIRKRTFGDEIVYYETVKIKISDISAEEYENTISEKRYNSLLKLADPEKRPVIKDRYCFVYDFQYFELDVFTFWQDRALLELELGDEKQAVHLPPEVSVMSDVSSDYRYKNSFLAGMNYENR